MRELLIKIRGMLFEILGTEDAYVDEVLSLLSKVVKPAIGNCSTTTLLIKLPADCAELPLLLIK